MTPKEKAKELSDKFYNLEGEPMATSYMDYTLAQDCAIVCVDEILSQLRKLINPDFTGFYHGAYTGNSANGLELIKYYEDVKNEINNL